jgi:predicted dienelactone hydrolase
MMKLSNWCILITLMTLTLCLQATAPLSKSSLKDPVMGYQELEGYDTLREEQVSGVVWYPAAPSSRLSPNPSAYQQGPLSHQAKILSSTQPYPLIVLSHGWGGNPYQFAWLIEPLLKAGFVVLTPQHRDFTQDGHPHIQHWNRPLDVHFLLDELLAGPFAKHVDADRLGVAGFSLGGSTALWLIGGMSTQTDAILPTAEDVHAAEFDGIEQLLDGFQPEKWKTSYKDPRFRSAVLMAPAWAWVFDPSSLSDIDLPVSIVAGDADEVLATKQNAGFLAAHMPEANYRILNNAGHFVFLSLPREDKVKELEAAGLSHLFTEPETLDRKALQEELAGQILQHFSRMLDPSCD